MNKIRCKICSGELTALQVYNSASPEIDDGLCQKHLREQLKLLKGA